MDVELTSRCHQSSCLYEHIPWQVMLRSQFECLFSMILLQGVASTLFPRARRRRVITRRATLGTLGCHWSGRPRPRGVHMGKGLYTHTYDNCRMVSDIISTECTLHHTPKSTCHSPRECLGALRT
jgi:hypothetical protein